MTTQLFALERLSRFMGVNTAKVFVAINVYFAVALRKMKWGYGRDSISHNRILFISISRYMDGITD